MNDYISKPVVPQTLTEILEKWLPKENVEYPVKKEELEKGGYPSPQSHSLIVFDRAAMLERLMGDEDLAKLIIDGFLEDIPRQIQALKEFVQSGDVSSSERLAHSIKGASANVGGEAVRAVAFMMEKAAKAGDLSAVSVRMGELEAQFVQFSEAVNGNV